MDPLAFLSDGEDDDEEADANDTGATEVKEPEAKKSRVDLETLRRVGWCAEAEDDSSDAEKLRSSFAALEQTLKAERSDVPPPLPEPAAAVVVARQPPEIGCEVPPDSVEVYDEGGADVPEAWSTFEDSCFGEEITSVLRGEGFEKPMPIQAHTWPILAQGRDLIGVAKTGSGKTLAFLLPCFAALLREGVVRKREVSDCSLPAHLLKQAAGAGAFSPEILVLAPSRELASQIESEAAKFTKTTGIATLACYGGGGGRPHQLGRLRERPECVVGTVGRLNDFIETEKSWFGVRTVRFLILDEADHMLGEGLSTQIRNITLDVETPRRQTMLFSATFDGEVRDLASWILKYPVEVRVGMRDPLRANPDVDQQIIIAKDDADKEGALKNLLRKQYRSKSAAHGKVLIFTCEPDVCEGLAKRLKNSLLGLEVETLHGNKKQDDRERSIMRFRQGDVPVLVSTNVAGRGLDIKAIELVVNYDPPEDAGDYVHRIGRTGRAGQKGTAITLLRRGPDGRAMAYIAQVMRRTGKHVPKELIDALKQRRGRDMEFAAQLLDGLCNFQKIERTYASAF